MRPFIFACIALFAAYAKAQTQTVTDADGNTIVQVVTLDPNGLATTQILQTIPATTTGPAIPPATSNPVTPSTTAAATAPTTASITPIPAGGGGGGGGQQGPVGQPDPTTKLPDGVTPYTYTTVIDGETVEVSDNFTPTTPPTVSASIGSSGSIMAYSEWLSIYGPKPSSLSANSGAFRLGSGLGVVCSAVLMLLGGAWVLL